MVKIQIISDLHLDINTDYIKNMVNPIGDVLLLAGDICACSSDEEFELFKAFIEIECSEFKYVFHVAGNHEYYSCHDDDNKSTIKTIKNKLKQINIANYKFLDNETYKFLFDEKEYIIIGSTMWSFIPEQYNIKIYNAINDYNYIYVDCKSERELKNYGPIRTLTINDTQEFFNESKEFVKNTLESLNDSKSTIILMTHHKLVWDYNHKYEDYSQYAFQNHMDWIIKPPLSLVIHGHTHEKYDKYINGIRVVSNPHGYDKEIKNYKNDFCIKL